uniref:B-form DNA mimic Ocr n=1 Tax=Bacillus phage KoopaTroopa TaxID=3234046 RepID=A0AB39C7Q2_9CAUD
MTGAYNNGIVTQTTTKGDVNMIELKDYELDGILDGEEDALESFYEYNGSTYICDATAEIADNYIPIYNYNVWENASDIQEHIENALAEGLVDTSGDVDLIKIFQAGYYQYYNERLSENLDILCYNYVAKLVNDYLQNEDTDSIDEDAIESRIESETDSYDHNNTFDALEEIAKGIIEEIKEEEFAM